MNCAIPGCDRDTYCKGWCSMHYQRAKRHGGNPLGGKDRTKKMPAGWYGRDKSRPTSKRHPNTSADLDVGDVRDNTPEEIAAARALLHRMAADDLIDALGLNTTRKDTAA